MCKRENCTEKEAQMYMIFEDCQDMGIKMNIAYADRLTGASDEREQMARLEKQFPRSRLPIRPKRFPVALVSPVKKLPLNIRLKNKEEFIMRNNNNSDLGIILQVIFWGLLILQVYTAFFCNY